MIHQAVLESPTYSFDKEEDAYVFTDYDYVEYYSINNHTDMIYMIANLGLHKQIDMSNLGPQAQSYYDDFRGINKGVIIRNPSYANNYGSWHRYVPAELSSRGDWTPYYFVPYYMVNIDGDRERWVRNCMKMIERRTRIRFVKDTEDYYTQTDIKGFRLRFPHAGQNRLRIERINNLTTCGKRTGNYAGCASTGSQAIGDTSLQLDNRTGFNQRTILHELGHTLRLLHEHQRSDRNNYYINIDPAQTPFDKIEYRNCRWEGNTLNYGSELDLASVMNYTGFDYIIDRPNTYFKLYRFRYNLEDDVPFISGATRTNANVYMNNRIGGTPLGSLLHTLDNHLIHFTVTNNNPDGTVSYDYYSNLSYFPNEYFPDDVPVATRGLAPRFDYIIRQYYPERIHYSPFGSYCSNIAEINTNIGYDGVATFIGSDEDTVHRRNYSLLLQFINSRIEGNNRYWTSDFNPNSRLNYFYVAPVTRNNPVHDNHFMSEGDFNTLNWVYNY